MNRCIGVLMVTLAMLVPVGPARAAPLTSLEYKSMLDAERALSPCARGYLDAVPDPTADATRFASEGRGPAFREQVLAVLPANSPRREYLSSQDMATHEGVVVAFKVLAEQLERSMGAVDERPFRLQTMLMTYYTAKLSGARCPVPKEAEEQFLRARVENLWPIALSPGLSLEQGQLESRVVIDCALNQPPFKGQSKDGAYRIAAAGHGDGSILDEAFKLLEPLGAAPEEQSDLIAIRAMSEPGRAKRSLEVLLDLAQAKVLGVEGRMRAQLLLSYYISDAGDPSCRLSPSALQFIGKNY